MDDRNLHPDQTVEVPHVEQKKKWSELDNKRKKQLEIGGGLLVGAALLGGGYHAWQDHQNKSEEEKKALTWGAQAWQRDAYSRTEEFRNHGPRAAACWILVEGRDKIPRSALEAGKDKDGNLIYIARAYFEDSIQIGRASPAFKSRLNVQGLGATPVEGGKDINNKLLYVARVEYNGGVYPAKVGEHLHAAHLAFSGREIFIDEYEVLCLN